MQINYIKTSESPTLSLCICTLESRKKLLELLTVNLITYSHGMKVEIISLCDNRELTVGRKRNILIQSAHKDSAFLAFLDDDDLISPLYFKRILEAAKFYPDVIGIEGIYTKNGNNPRKFIHTMKCKDWHEDVNGVYWRCPNHLNPIKTDLVRQTMFKEINFGEDKDFSTRIYPLLKTEVYIDTPIYYYRYDENKSQTKGR